MYAKYFINEKREVKMSNFKTGWEIHLEILFVSQLLSGIDNNIEQRKQYISKDDLYKILYSLHTNWQERDFVIKIIGELERSK